MLYDDNFFLGVVNIHDKLAAINFHLPFGMCKFVAKGLRRSRGGPAEPILLLFYDVRRFKSKSSAFLLRHQCRMGLKNDCCVESS